MKRLLSLIALAAVTLTSCAATMNVQATAPVRENDAACAATPVLVPPPPGARYVVWFAWTGPASGSASVPNLAPGDTARITRAVPAGSYSLRAWAVDAAGNAGCDTTITVTVTAPPARVGGLRLSP